MKRDIHRIITLVKASPNLKTNIICSITMFLSGLTIEIVSSYSKSNNIGGIFIINSVLYLYQGILLANKSGLVQSSPSAKKLQTVYPFFIRVPIYLLTFIIISLHRFYITNKALPDISSEEHYASQCTYILCLSIICFCYLVFEIISYKKLVLGLIGLVFSIIPLVICVMSNNKTLDIFHHISLNSAIVAGFLIITAGSLLSILIANLLYKYPVSAHVMKVNNKA